MTLTIIPTEQAVERLPEFAATTERLLTQWVKDKMAIEQVLAEDCPSLYPHDHVVDVVHQNWLNHMLNQHD
jgi:hypothetical protein